MKCDTIIVGLALCIAGVAYYTVRQDGNRLRELRASNDSLQESIKVTNEDIQRHRQTDQLERAAHEAQIIRLTRSYRQTIVRTDTLLDTLVLAGDTGAVRDLIASERREASAVIAYQDSTIQWMGSRIAYWRDTVLTARGQQLEVSQRLLHEALRAKRPSHLVRGMMIGAGVVGVVSLLR